MRWRRPLIRGLLALAMLTGLPACSRDAGEPPPLTGTYAIAICKGRCRLADSARAVFVGRLVLVDTPIVISQLPQAKRTYLELTSMFKDVDGPLNACFTLRPVKASRHEYHGIPYLRAPEAPTSVDPTGLTHWE